MTTLIEVHPASKYSAEEIERGLVLLALESGNVGRTRKLLKQEWGKAPDANTIGRWLERYRDHYAEIRQKVAPELKLRMAEVHADLAARLANLENQTIDQLEQEISDLSARDKANLLRNAAISSGVHIDKSQLLRGDSTAIVERRELPEIFRALASKGVVIEGVATELPLDQPELEAGKP